MKKAILMVLVFLMIFGVVGCGSNEASKSDSNKNNTTMEEDMSDSDNIKNESEVSQPEEEIQYDTEWKTHPQDFKLIALTFDDAPSGNSYNIFDILNKYGGAGTLFIQGENIEVYGYEQLEYAVERGFELANHTYSHPYLTELNKVSIKGEIKAVDDLVFNRFGFKTKFLRPGYVAVNDSVFEVAQELNMPIISGGGISAKDYEPSTTAEDVKNAVINGAYDGAIVLLHVWSEATKNAMDEICSTLYNQGYRFVTVSQLFEYKGISYDIIPKDRLIGNTDF